METNATRSTEFPPSVAPDPSVQQLKCPAPAGQTPPTQERGIPSTSTFVPSPIECASPTTGIMYHPATPMPVSSLFHNTPASPPIPTFNVTQEAPQNSPMLCGPTPTSTPVPVHTSFSSSPQTANIEYATETFSNSPTPHAPHLSTIKGNFTSFVGKVTHNPDKQQAGNAMIASRKEEKAAYCEQKAAEWELKGNTAKAQKNREKAARYRQMAQSRLQQPLSAPANKDKVPAKMDKAARLDAKAQEYERRGEDAKAVKCHNKAHQVRQKHNLSQPIGGPTTPGIITATPIAPSI
eukprot:Phypoly_transcript_13760.p1 GENE.Phypoly_transcript_13760~~Phypoly_transcript_13760.p1  ORF type:complete len:294 (+),score=68.36 Phypoly_transcript_13760:111-992(+)